jgi:membrane associated rhomboid family serine protease
MFPLRDDIPNNSFPFVTVGIVAVNTVLFIYQASLGREAGHFIASLGAVPYEISHSIDIFPTIFFPVFLTLFTAMFLHGGFLHLFGNMLYLWIFGDNVESSMGHMRFLFFYLVCGLIAIYTQIYLYPDSKIPIIGASGAVSGVLGAYLLLFPYARISTIVILGFFIKMVRIPAIIFLGFWILIQIFYSSAPAGRFGGNVAWFAHIGGFFAGLMLISLIKKNCVRLGILRR